MGEEVNVI